MYRYFKLLLSIGLFVLPVSPAIAQDESVILDQSLFPHDEPPIDADTPARPEASPETNASEATTSETASGIRLQIDLSSRRLTLYQGEMELSHFPIAVGREGWQTPIGEWEVRQMIHDPAWRNPFTGRVIPGGDPENPLGDYWIGFWTDGENWIGMHGTPNPESVGRAASHGCIRLYNHDIAALFALVRVGTPVIVVP
ncbi:L,D-transpeptidase [Microcoleus sp. FACHB-1515]|uniref:L,D-transpeptidase n=1 Tax=Cyanophyceae TaxID=3028117 RepID=UPI001685F9F1|nr:L,D-transpeptidase [Microcoleus sp. FACHB-1515]MBD2089793.1 L,D-transpeptidase [Microcoleus sp. FACHB-1515]